MKKCLFIDRDGTLIVEPPVTEQVNTLDELELLPGVIRNLYFIRKHLDFELVMVSNQDGLGTPSYPRENFDRVQNKLLQILRGEGIEFDDVLIDESFAHENKPTRKPGTGMLTAYMDGSCDLAGSYVIGDRATDEQLARNLGAGSILIGSEKFPDWDKISEFLFAGERTASLTRTTKETDITISLNLDGTGKCDISTGLGFFDHMLEQIGRHSGMDLTVKAKGDLNVDEHHTIEDVGICLGEALYKALGSKRGIERYGYCLPMDDCLCSVALDFGGRPWLVWDADFKRERIGDVPTEMFFHFFKSLSDNAKMNLNIKAEGQNEHHKAEGIFKAFARSIKMAAKRDVYRFELPSTKGSL